MIAGSLLVVVAAASTFAAVTGTIEADTQAVVVASRDISPGTRLQRQDLRVVKMSAPPKTGSVAGSPAQLEGLTALGPIGEGELVQANNLLRKESAEDQPELSFAIPAARAVGGDLRPGERIEVLATDKGDAKAGARVAAVASVVEVQSGSQGVGKNGDTVVTVAVDDSAKAAAIAAAVDAGDVTIVRITGTPR